MPFLTKLGIKVMPAADTDGADQTQDSGRASEKEESDNTDDGNEDK